MFNLAVTNYQKEKTADFILIWQVLVLRCLMQPFHAECCDYIGENFVELWQCLIHVKEFVQISGAPVDTVFFKWKYRENHSRSSTECIAPRTSVLSSSLDQGSSTGVHGAP